MYKRKCKYCGKKLPFLIFRDAFGRDTDSCLRRCKKCGKCNTEDNPYCLFCNSCKKCLRPDEGYKATGFWSFSDVRWCKECYEQAIKKGNDKRMRLEEKENDIKMEKEYILQKFKEEKLQKRKLEIEKYEELRKQIEEMPIYKRWRDDVIKRCGNKCQMCGNNSKLEVHHRVSLYSMINRFKITSTEQAFECIYLWSIENGEVLCKECHDKMESSKNRQNYYIKE